LYEKCASILDEINQLNRNRLTLLFLFRLLNKNIHSVTLRSQVRTLPEAKFFQILKKFQDIS
jgi:hypothetical protein